MLILTGDKSEDSPSSQQQQQASATSSSTAGAAAAPPSTTLLVSSLGMSGDPRTGIRYPSEYVKLNIGGSLHYTTISTLRKHDTMLRAMFGGRMEVLTDSEGEKNLPRPPSINSASTFPHCLNSRLDSDRSLRQALWYDIKFFERRLGPSPGECQRDWRTFVRSKILLYS